MQQKIESDEGERFILFHKHGTSARTRFLCFSGQSVLFPQPLPELAQRFDETLPRPPQSVVEQHPAMLLQQLAAALEIEEGELELETEFEERVDIPGEVVRIYLVRFTAIDPPFDLAERLAGRFIDLTQGRGLRDIELLLLRRAYEVIMEG
jgi:hypothetical protein